MRPRTGDCQRGACKQKAAATTSKATRPKDGGGGMVVLQIEVASHG